MSPPPGWLCAVTANGLDNVSHKHARDPCTRPLVTELSYLRAVHVLGRSPMDNRVASCQPPTGATALLRFGLPSPPSVVRMVMAPRSASEKHPVYVVCKCGLGCCVCGGRRVGVGAWGCGPLVMLHVRALFVGGCVWVKCPCGGCGPHPGCWVLGWCWCSRQVVWLSAAARAGPLPPSGPSLGNLRSAWIWQPTHWRGRVRAPGACL